MKQKWRYRVPDSFFIGTDKCVYYKKIEKNGDVNLLKVTGSKCYVLALACTDDDGVWHRLVIFWDFDGVRQEILIPLRAFANRGAQVVQLLADAGLSILPGMEKWLVTYLASFTTGNRILLTRRTGTTADLRAHVLSSRIILGEQGDRVIQFMPEQHCPSEVAIRSEGIIEEYWERVLLPARGNPLMIFAFLVALSAPIIRFLFLDNGGFHFFGYTSRGKSLLLQLAASIFGFGGDPNRTVDTYIQRWSMTNNAAEGVAAAFSEKVLCLDELESYMGGDLGGLMYFLTGGKGKAAMSASRSLLAARSWYTCILSSGEKSIRSLILQQGGKPMAGQATRVVEVPVGDNIILEPHGLPKAEFAERQKQACAECFGHLGPLFIESLLADFATGSDDVISVEMLRQNHEHFTRQLTIPGMRPEHQRAVRRFAAAQLAGEVAIHYELLPFSAEEVEEAVLFARNLWLREAGVLTDVENGLFTLQTFIQENRDSFPLTNDIDANIAESLGFQHPTRDVIFFSDEKLQAASGGLPPLDVARELRNRSLLVTHEAGRLTVKQPLAAIGNEKKNLYAVRGEIMRSHFGAKFVNLSTLDPSALASSATEFADV